MRAHSNSRVVLTLVTTVGLALVLSGCTNLFGNKTARSDVTPPPPLNAETAALQPLGAAQADSCVSAILEPERAQLLQVALSDSKLQTVKALLERRGLRMNSAEALAVKLPDGEQLLIPFGERAHLVWTRTNGQTTALGLVRQGNKTLNLSGDGSERPVRMLDGAKAQRLLTKLREKPKFREFEQKLQQKGKRLAESKLRVMLDETSNLAILGLANEGSERIAHQLRIRLKANKDDELDESAEPQIQATTCGNATGEAVASAATLQPQFAGDVGGGSWGVIGDGDQQICTSQWGYTYSCTSTAPQLQISVLSLQLATFVGQKAQTTVRISNSGGGTLTGTASVQDPFTIVSGASFSLSAGQSYNVVVRFSSTMPGTFTSSLQVATNIGNRTVPATGVAYKVSITPVPLNMGLIFIGYPRERKITLKNEDTMTLSLTASTSEPFSIVSGSSFTLAPNQSHEITVRVNPTTPRIYEASVRLSTMHNGTVNVEIPIGATAYIYEEYRATLQETFREACHTMNEVSNIRDDDGSLPFPLDSGIAPSPARSTLFLPERGRNLLFHGVDPCLVLDNLDAFLQMADSEENTSYPPILDMQPSNFNPTVVRNTLRELADRYKDVLIGLRANPNLTADGVKRELSAWLRGAIDGYRNDRPDFNIFVHYVNQQSTDILGRFAEFASAVLGALGTPIISPLLTARDLILSFLGLFENPVPGAPPLTGAHVIIGFLTIITEAYPNTSNAVDAILGYTSGRADARLLALMAIAKTGALAVAQGQAVEQAGLTPTLYNKFLEQLRYAYGQGAQVLGRFIEAYASTLGLRNLSIEQHANMAGGVIALVDLSKNGWYIHAVPAAGLNPVCRLMSCLGEVHVIAWRNNLAGFERVVAFIHVEARLATNEIQSVAAIVTQIINDIWQFYYRDSLLNAKWGHFVVVVSYSSSNEAAGALKNQLGNPRLPVIIIYVDENGIWRVTCAGHGCPSQQQLNEIAIAMGYPPGSRYDWPSGSGGGGKFNFENIVGSWPPEPYTPILLRDY